MLLYRIGLKRFAGVLSGEGARIHGGRWNAKGVPVIYTSDSIALALLEYLVHAQEDLLPPSAMLTTIRIPEPVKVESVHMGNLPPDWNSLPFSARTTEIGAEWVARKESLLLRVPSVIVPFQEHANMLINPLHPGFSGVVVERVVALPLDVRLLNGR